MRDKSTNKLRMEFFLILTVHLQHLVQRDRSLSSGWIVRQVLRMKVYRSEYLRAKSPWVSRLKTVGLH